MTGAIIIGAVASVICYSAIMVKLKMGYDDSLDAFGIHGVGGFWGVLAVGLFACPLVGGKAGVFYGNPGLFAVQCGMALTTAAYCFAATVILYLVVEKTVGFRANEKEEDMGLDLSQHGEEGYTR
jgi:Amt family ammonium transporter